MIEILGCVYCLEMEYYYEVFKLIWGNLDK